MALMWAVGASGEQLDILMPPHKTTREDTYLCTSVRVPGTRGYKLTAVEPHTEMKIAHHMLLFGCHGEPNNPQDVERDGVWECHHVTACKGEQEAVLYGWGRNAPKLELPDGVGFSVGGEGGLNHLVLQVHYLQVRPPDDHSGVSLTLSTEAYKYSAGMMAYAINFKVPPGKPSHLINNTCCYSGLEPVRTVAFRVHTHWLGRSVYMTRMSGQDDGDRLAERDPQLPQGFVPVLEESVILPGETLRVTCDFNSTSETMAVYAGSKHNNEMCNLYMMQYAEMPYFVHCADNTPVVDLEGPGGMLANATFTPEDVALGTWAPPHLGEQISGVTRGPDGYIWALHRGPRSWDIGSFNRNNELKNKTAIDEDVVVQLDPQTGEVVRKWGKGMFYMPHMITVDYDGNVWVVDTGRHQVLKFNADGDPIEGDITSVGLKLEPGHDKEHLCKPTQVVPLNDGGFLVSDGYCNKRVLRYSKAGEVVGIAEDDSMEVVHSLAVDECLDAIYVANREAGKLVVFGLSDMKRKGQVDVKEDGKVFAVTPGPYGTVLALVGKWEPNSKLWVYEIGSEYHDVVHKWEVHGVEYPHDFAIGAAPMELTGAGERLPALYVAETKPKGSSLKKFVLMPSSFQFATTPLPMPKSTAADAPVEAPSKPEADDSTDVKHPGNFITADDILSGDYPGSSDAQVPEEEDTYLDTFGAQKTEPWKESSNERSPEVDVHRDDSNVEHNQWAGSGSDVMEKMKAREDMKITEGHKLIEEAIRGYGSQATIQTPDNTPPWLFVNGLKLFYVGGPLVAMAFLFVFMRRSRHRGNARYQRLD
eukprot:evm.model.scf_760EXC.6 EVM.evm.TU.scf_760EXC.6   scf_760EXC:55513-65279(+)